MAATDNGIDATLSWTKKIELGKCFRRAFKFYSDCNPIFRGTQVGTDLKIKYFNSLCFLRNLIFSSTPLDFSYCPRKESSTLPSLSWFSVLNNFWPTSWKWCPLTSRLSSNVIIVYLRSRAVYFLSVLCTWHLSFTDLISVSFEYLLANPKAGCTTLFMRQRMKKF